MALIRFFEPGMARKIGRMPNWRSTDHPPDPEMVEGGCAGRGPLDRDNGGHPAGISGISCLCQYLLSSPQHRTNPNQCRPLSWRDAYHVDLGCPDPWCPPNDLSRPQDCPRGWLDVRGSG